MGVLSIVALVWVGSVPISLVLLYLTQNILTLMDLFQMFLLGPIAPIVLTLDLLALHKINVRKLDDIVLWRRRK